MKKINKKFWSIVSISIGFLFFAGYLLSDLYKIKYLDKLFLPVVFWFIMILYIFFVIHWLYKKEWRNVLGLTKNNITKKIIYKSFKMGLLMSIIVNVIIFIVLFIFNIPLTNLYGNDISIFELLFLAIIIAPVTEEIFFRGFLQGVLAKNYAVEKNKRNIIIIVLIPSLLFTVAHYHYIINTEILHWVLLFIGVFILSLYSGYLRNKYQSVIPSIFAHFGFNSAIVIAAPIFVIMLVLLPNGLGQFKQITNQIGFKNDSGTSFVRCNVKPLF